MCVFCSSKSNKSIKSLVCVGLEFTDVSKAYKTNDFAVFACSVLDGARGREEGRTTRPPKWSKVNKVNSFCVFLVISA